MSRIYKSVDELVGSTPIVELMNLAEEFELEARIFAKLEYLNPAGSIKDRVAKAMLEAAEREGKIKPGDVIIEPTSGNTGIALASIGTAKGYRVIIVMPDNMSEERRKLIAAYGAEVVLTAGEEGLKSAIQKAEELAKETPNSFIPAQFDNPENTKIHLDTTGPEIYSDMNGLVDIFVAGAGTGGTISGTGRYLKEKNPALKVIAVEPAASPLLSGGNAGAHGLQGIGANFIPETLDVSVYDDIIAVTEEQAYAAARLLGAREGVLVGISSGAALHAALTVADRPENEGKTIAVILPDTGDRYLSTPLFE